MSRTLRAGSALLLVAAAAGSVYAAEVFPAPVGDADPVAVRSVRVPAGSTTAVCHAAPELPAGSVAYDADFTPVPVEPRAALRVGSFPRDAVAGEGGYAVGEATAPLTGANARWFTAGSFDTAGWARLDPIGEESALVAGTGAWLVEAGDLRSLVAAPCLPPASELWLVGGSTSLGRGAALELVNPGETTATVRVEGWGPTGPLDLPLLEAVPLAPRTATRVLVEASAPDVERLALHVIATGGRVSAAVVDTALTGVTPQGVEMVVPTLAPATELVLAGVALPETDPEGGDPASSAHVLRLLNPGDRPAVASVELLGTGGAVAVPGAGALTVDAGAVFEITLAGLPAGDHAVRVTSDRPLAGAVQTGRAAAVQGDDAVTLDRAWSVASPPATRSALALPDLAAARVVLTNPGNGEAAVRLHRYDADGAAAAPLEVRVPAGSSVTVEPGAAGVVLESDLPVVAAALLEAGAPDGTLVSVLPFTVDADYRQSVDVLIGEW